MNYYQNPSLNEGFDVDNNTEPFKPRCTLSLKLTSKYKDDGTYSPKGSSEKLLSINSQAFCLSNSFWLT